MKKRFFSILLTALMMLSLMPEAAGALGSSEVEAAGGGTPAAGQSQQAGSDMLAFLIDRGYPSDYLSGLIPQQLEDLYDLVCKKDLYYLQTTHHQIQPYGNIPSQQLSFDTTISYTPVTISGVTYYYNITVYVDYEWDELPIVRGVDAITVNWDGDILTYNEDFISKDYAYSPTQRKWITYKEWDKPNALNQGGLGINTYINYEEQISPSEWMYADGLKGSMSFSLTPEPRLSMSIAPGANSTVINGEYVHNKNPYTGTLSFTYQGIGIAVSGSGSMQDSIADPARIDYTRVE